ncbi:MAG TPA: DNA helicase II, partial [Gammaproteobacteria bacterium]|nr:DNA helicase II [Gammaproteobacteria bacterium]
LCYVAITRSMQDLVISYTEHRMLHGFSSPSQPSRFLFEIPETLVNESSRLTRLGLKTKQTKIEKADGSISLGQRIAHPKFGEGVVIGLEGDGDHIRVQVNFESEGIKWLVLGYAKLKLM